MDDTLRTAGKTRRDFLADILACGAGAAALNLAGTAVAAQARTDWKSQIGLQLYTVRDLLTEGSKFDGVLSKVAAIGYKEVEPTGYGSIAPKEFRAMLDRHGLRMPSTHAGASGTAAEMEKQFEGLQIMGATYSTVGAEAAPGGARGGRAGAAGGRGGAASSAPASVLVRNGFTQAENAGPNQPKVTLDTAQRRAARYNESGKLAQKFGIKVFHHNHTGEWEKLLDSDRTLYDVLLAETDPSLVTMQLDIGWAYIAGADPIALFQKHPGRFELWHVKDVFGLKTINPALSPNERISSTSLVPIGAGHVDYERIFQHTKVAGVKHFSLDHGNAASWGDSLTAARASYEALVKIVSQAA